MPAMSQNDFLQVFVGDTPVAITIGGPSTLNDGEIGIFTPAGVRLTEATAATATQFVIYQGRGSSNPPLKSGTINKADLVSAKCTRKVYSAAAEQVDYIGHNGTSGSIDVIDDNLYYVRLHLDQSKTSNHGGIYVKHGVYKSGVSGTTEAEVAAGLTANLVKNFSREKDNIGTRLIKFERVHSDAGTANTITAGTDATHYKFTYGSKIVVGTNGSGTAMLGTDEIVATTVAGDYLRAGTATTSPVYKIVTVTAGTASTPMMIELDIPYQGSTTEIAIGSTEYITAALAAAGNFGIKCTGISQQFVLGGLHYKKVKWVTKLQDCGTTDLTLSTASAVGVGTYEQMAELEWFAQGNEGTIYRKLVPTFTPRADVSNQGYDQIVLKVEEQSKGMLTNPTAHKEYVLVIPNSTPAFAAPATSDDITDVLEVLIWGSANGNFDI